MGIDVLNMNHGRQSSISDAVPNKLESVQGVITKEKILFCHKQVGTFIQRTFSLRAIYVPFSCSPHKSPFRVDCIEWKNKLFARFGISSILL
jgi:hypothetical protein